MRTAETTVQPLPSRRYAPLLLLLGPTVGTTAALSLLAIEPMAIGLRIAVIGCGVAVMTGLVFQGLSDAIALGTAGRSKIVNLALLWCSTLLLFIACEGFFMFSAKTHGVGVTLAGQLWRKRHLHYNALGYRDPEPDYAAVANKRKILVVGDSFTMGHGIARLEDRFTSILQSRLTRDYWVANLGKGGTDTRSHLTRLLRYPVAPDILVLQYFPNDIGEAAIEAKHGLPGIGLYSDIPAALRHIVTHSFVLDWIYWTVPHRDHVDWWAYFARMYATPEVASEHEKDLIAFADYARDHGIPLVVVFFPFLHEDLSGSSTGARFIHDFCDKFRIPVLDVSRLVGDLSIRERVANNNDVHANEEVHRRVGEALFELLTRLELVSDGVRGHAVDEPARSYLP